MDFLFQFLFSPLPTSAVVSLLALAAAALFYLHSRPSPVRSPVDLDNQSVGVKVEGPPAAAAALEHPRGEAAF